MNETVINFLLDKSDIAIQYRIKRDLCEHTDAKKLSKLQNELAQSKKVIHLLECLKNHKEYHGATLYAVENSLNMLVDRGLQYRRGFSEFDDIVKTIEEEAKNRSINENHVLGYLSHIVVVSALLRAGVREEWLIEFAKNRINDIYDFVQYKEYDIYDDITEYKGIPKNYQNRPIIRPCLYEKGRIRLPLIYDLYAFASIQFELEQDYQNKINEIITYILDERFQLIKDGYGVLSDKRNYWAMGWDPKPTNVAKEYYDTSLLLKMELMSNFSIVQKSKWFTQALNVMKQFIDVDGIYHYPKNYLTEKNACWILGNHMGLGENRRKKQAMVVEGTFRTLLILKNCKELKICV
ncbi:MAG: hypothetical protein IJA07_10375 [Agathobacter sp.]|nr:hypothetical protein [Agathobacter sp.]MBQ3559907.1 hypothetical protein [Agathobacter sp.]